MNTECDSGVWFMQGKTLNQPTGNVGLGHMTGTAATQLMIM